MADAGGHIHHIDLYGESYEQNASPIVIYRKTNGGETTTIIGMQESGKAIFPGGKLITDESPEDFEDDGSIA